MSNNEIIYANATAVSLQNKLINQEKLARLADSKSGIQALKVLVEFGFGDGESVKSPFEFEKLCQVEEKKLNEFILLTCPNEYAKKALTISYDYHNIKSALKMKFGKNVVYNKLTYDYATINPEELLELVKADEYSVLTETQRMFCNSVDLMHVSQTLTPAKIDILGDKAMYSEIVDLADKSKEELLIKYFKAKIDLANINVAVRAKHFEIPEKSISDMLIEGGEISIDDFASYIDGNGEALVEKLRFTEYKDLAKLILESEEDKKALTRFEQEAENVLIRLFKSKKFDPPVGLNQYFSYIISKKVIIRNVRVIMVCINNDLDKAEIRERLVETYD